MQGDGHTMCNVPTAEAAAQLMPERKYHLRGHMDIETLDAAVCKDIKVRCGVASTCAYLASRRCIALMRAGACC